MPTGQTQFQFKVAGLNFHSISYDWLVIAGAKAKYKGIGTINGQGEYYFMLSAIDGQVKGGDGIDKFRIKIWGENQGNNVIYDNQMGEEDAADATDAIEGGSIVIHKGDELSKDNNLTDLLGAETVPGTYALYQNQPNPFNPSTRIIYQLSERSQVRLEIFDVLGRKVKEAVFEEQNSGTHQFLWRPDSNSGIYFCRLEATALQGDEKTFRSMIKMTFAK